MREDVLILLNEREPLKQQMAIALAEQLEARHLSHHRLKPSAQLANIVVERRPKVLVADFLLGDEGTALDLLSNLRDRDPEGRIQSILWTDERSVSVAVTAMKLGARDYVELGGLKDVEKILRSVEEALAASSDDDVVPSRRQRAAAVRAAEEPIAQAPTARQALAGAEMALRQNATVIVLFGEEGCGRSTLAQYIHARRRNAGAFIEIELENWPGTSEQIFGESKRGSVTPMLSAGSTIVIEHAEFDTHGEILDACAREAQNIWGSADKLGRPLLVVGVRDEKCAAAWTRLAGAKRIDLPGIADRKDDVLPLLQRFLSEAKQLSSATKIELTSEFINAVGSWRWPGNVRQLRACMLEVATSPVETLQEWLGDPVSQENGRSGSRMTEQGVILRALQRHKDLYERLARPELSLPSPLEARKVLDESGGNVRIAASRLGVGVPQVRAALEGSK